MSRAPLAPTCKLSRSDKASSHGSSEGIRKRVCKACDRCRLKKNKCDGSNPCSRCKADNAICAFGERKRSHDKIHPKGYVEMLEQQQIQLISGLQEMYHRLQRASAWDGTHLDESRGHPLTHDILAALNILESKHDGSGEMEAFEENCEKLHSRLTSEGAGFARRRGSCSSDSGHSHQDQPWTTSSHNTLVQSKPLLFAEDSIFPSATSSPPTHSPISGSRLQPQPKQHHPVPLPIKLSPLQKPTVNIDPQLYSPEWARVSADVNALEQIYRTKHAMEAPDFDSPLSMSWDQTLPQFDSSTFNNHFPAYQGQMGNGNGIGNTTGGNNDLSGINDLGLLDTLDIDCSKFLQPQELMT